MTLEGSFEFSSFDFPNFYRAVFGGSRNLSKLRMERHISYWTFMPLHLKFRWHLRNVQVFDFQIRRLLSDGIAPGQLFFQTLDFLFQISNFFLKT